MSAGICGKRLGIEEIFGSTSPVATPPAAKRSRFSWYGSPEGFGFVGSEDAVTYLLRMFPSMDREVIETILNAHEHNIDDAIKSLHALSIRDNGVANDSLDNSSANATNDNLDPAMEGAAVTDEAEQPQQMASCVKSESIVETAIPQEQPTWVDIFVQEMTKASDWNDARLRLTSLLAAFQENVLSNHQASEERESVSLKEQLQCLLRENQILKRAVSIQHERNLEHAEKLKEVEQLKRMLNQYQEQVRTLELNNYALNVHLQRAQEANGSIPNRFHPDIF